MKKSFYKKYRPIPGFCRVLGCLLLLMGLAGCGQDPLFYHISYEEEPVDPVIEGTPGKIVVDSQKNLYTSNGRIFVCDTTQPGSWYALGGDPGTVYDVTLVGDTLYCMTISGSDTGVWKKDQNGWQPIPNDTGYSFIQSVFGTDDRLFVGARQSGSSGNFAILYEDGNKLSLLTTLNGNLNGAVQIGSTYYLATQGKGILEVSSLAPNISPPALQGTGNTHIMALLLDGGKLAAATRDGTIFYGDPTALQPNSYSYTFTRAFALWTNPDTQNKLLLVGLRGGSSSSSNGYREIPINNGNLGVIRSPGEGATGETTVSNTAKYNSSLQKQAVNAIIMAPDEFSIEEAVTYPVIFASTQKSGLWVYRDGSWKAQE
jgi:hypothetical protein